LYASALARSGNTAEAALAFDALDNKDALTGEYSAEYAKVLFSLKRFSEAYGQSLRSSDAQKDYLCGLCQVNLRNWNTAKNHFTAYIKSMSGSGASFNKLVFYYKGYAEYCLAEFKNAYSSFIRFCSEASSEELRKYRRSGYEYAAKCALQYGDLKNASAQAENMMKASVGAEESRAAVIFAADVFTDSGEYDRAVYLLAPYSLTKDDFAIEALFRTARIYERKGDADKADKTYSQVFTKYPKSSFAEEAMYRPGEIYYAAENYALAFNRFNAFIYQYPAGRFAEAAMYFGGDSAFRLGEINRAIILNKTLIQRYPSSVYAYGALKNLMDSYYKQEAYQQAIEVARTLVKDYPTQAASDEVGEKLAEMEKIIKGTDRRVAKKQSEYEKLGGLKTVAGRIAGSELVKLYAEDTATQKEALNLALSLLDKQKDESELAYAADNAEFAADYYRHEQKLADAAKLYLKAAQFFRSVGDSQKAASSLYSAAEAFAADGYAGDARETAELLKSLYPDTRYAERVGDLIK
jgi:TolA-binding protein